MSADRRGFVAWVHYRHAAPYESLEAEVKRMEAQLAEVQHLLRQGIVTQEERGNGERDQEG